MKQFLLFVSFVFLDSVLISSSTRYYESDSKDDQRQNVLPFTLGILTCNEKINTDNILDTDGETLPPNYRQIMMLRTAKKPNRKRLSLASLASSIRFYINLVRTTGLGLDKITEKLFCTPKSRGTDAALFLIDDNATLKHSGDILVNFMTMVSNFAGLPTITWSSTPIMESDKVDSTDLPELLLAPSVRSQAEATFEFLKQILPEMRASILVSLKATGYEIFVNELRRLVAEHAEHERISRFQFDSHLRHMSTQFIELVHLGSSSTTSHNLRENLLYLRDNSRIRVFVLYTEPNITDVLMKEAHSLGMTTTEYLWICGRPAFVETPETPKNYPAGLLAVTYNTSLAVQKIALKAAVRVWVQAVRRLVLIAKTKDELIPKISCTRFKAPKWKYEKLFKSILARRLKMLLTASSAYSALSEIQIVGFDIARQWREVGFWSPKSGARVTDQAWLNRYSRQTDPEVTTSGGLIRFVTLQEPPYVVYKPLEEHAFCPETAALCRLSPLFLQSQHEHSHLLTGFPAGVLAPKLNKTHACCQGFVIDIIKSLSRDIGFRYEISEVIDRKWGARKHVNGQKTDEWNGLVQAILNGTADVVGTSLKINTDRSSVIDFTIPFYQTGVTVLVKLHEGVISSVAFLKPFSVATWFVVFVILVNICALVIYYLENVYLKVDKKKFRTPQGTIDAPSLFDSFWLVLSMLFHATTKSAPPRSTSARFIVNIWAFFCVIFMSSFMANLAAFMITVQQYHDFSGIDDKRLQNPFSKNPPWKFGTIPHGATEQLIRKNFPDMHSYMGPFMHNDVDDGVDAVVHGDLDAFIYDASVLSYKAGRDNQCRLKTVGKWHAPTGYGFGMPRSSKWLHDFNRQILEYQVSGYLQHLEDFWLSSSCKGREESHKSHELSLRQLWSLFAILAASVGCCCFFLIGDHYYSKRLSLKVRINMMRLSQNILKRSNSRTSKMNKLVYRRNARTGLYFSRPNCTSAGCRVRHRLLQRQLEHARQRLFEMQLQASMFQRPPLRSTRSSQYSDQHKVEEAVSRQDDCVFGAMSVVECTEKKPSISVAGAETEIKDNDTP